MYPLNMFNPVLGGFALANDEDEHKALTSHGYQPPFVDADAKVGQADATTAKPEESGPTVESVRASLDAAGIAYSKRLGLAKLIELLPAA